MDAPPTDPNIVLQSLRFWKEFDIDQLDQQATKISEFQDESVTERKRLAEETKKWGALPDDGKLPQMRPLLKFYQKEVDRLTNRAKAAEQAFLDLYGIFTKAPDHSSAISKAEEAFEKLSQVHKLEIENQKLFRELEEFRGDFQEIQNQEVTIRRYEDKIQHYEQQMEDLVELKVKEAETKLDSEYRDKITSMKEREEELNGQVKETQDELRAISQNYEISQNQIFTLESKYESEIHAKQSQIDMLTNEFDRMSTRIATLEADIVQLVREKEAEIELQVVQKDIRIVELSKQVQDLESQLDTERASAARELSSAAEQVTTCKKSADELQRQISALPTLEEFNKLKTKLTALKAFEVEMGAEIPEGVELTSELILRDKNRKLETENIKMKSAIFDLEERVKTLESDLQQTRTELGKKVQLVLQLENDLAQNQVPGTPSKPKQQFAHVDSDTDTATVDTSSSSSDTTMLNIVMAQRDRFKARIAQLEQENSVVLDQMKMLKGESHSLKEDNVKLYQKIKYLQSYREMNQGPRAVDLEMGAPADTVEEKYRPVYEETVNPFNAFHSQEKTKRIRELNPAERLIYQMSSFFLANKQTRMFLFGYAVILHFMVFLTTYKLAHSSCDVDGNGA